MLKLNKRRRLKELVRKISFSLGFVGFTGFIDLSILINDLTDEQVNNIAQMIDNW